MYKRQAVSADNKTRSGNVDVQKNNNSLTASKMDSGKKQDSSEADVDAAEESSEPDTVSYTHLDVHKRQTLSRFAVLPINTQKLLRQTESS